MDPILTAVAAQDPAQAGAQAAPSPVPSTDGGAQNSIPENISLEQLRRRRMDAARQRMNPAPVQPPASAPQAAPDTQPAATPNAHAQPPAEDPNTDTAPPPQDPAGEEASAADLEALADLDGLPPEIAEAIAEAIDDPDKQSLTKKLVKRIHKLVAQRNERDQKIAELEQPAKPPQTQPQPAAAPTSVDPRLAAFDSQLGLLTNALRNLESNPHGLTVAGENGAQIELDSDQVAALRQEYADKRTELISKRATVEVQVEAERKQTIQQAWTQAAVAYPWITQKETPEFKLAVTELQGLSPAVRAALQADPGFPMMIGRYVAGMKSESAGAKSAVQPPMKRPRTAGQTPTQVVAAPSAVPVKGTTQAAEVKEAEARYRETGSLKDYAKLRKLKAANAA